VLDDLLQQLQRAPPHAHLGVDGGAVAGHDLRGLQHLRCAERLDGALRGGGVRGGAGGGVMLLLGP
jgi:hypothetical protein